VIESDYFNLPFADHSFDCAYTIGPFKYLTMKQMPFALREANRVLKSGATFLLYGYALTDIFDSTIPEQITLLRDFENSAAMPPSKTNQEIISATEQAGFSLVNQLDLSQQFKWYYYLQSDPILIWLISSKHIASIVKILEYMRITPKDFSQFNKLFLAMPVKNLIQLGKQNILSTSNVWIFKKGNHRCEY
jgi:ubiquinone/menaquinone biosynthesis C-methylase UbiE